MILKEQLTRWFDRSTHGYFIAKKHFAGKYLREVLLTVYDKKSQKSCYGYIYVCESNILLVVAKRLSFDPGVYEFERNDDVSIIEDIKNLKSILTSDPAKEFYFNVSTNSPKSALLVNQQLILLTNVQTDLKYGSAIKGAVHLRILVKKNDLIKTKNLKLFINTILNKEKLDSISVTLPGINPIISIINIYLSFLLFGFILLFIIFLYTKSF